MDKHPFAKPTDQQDALASRRRSTRIEFTTTVVLSGKDAGGTPFREFTQTVTVNLHGCKVRTSYRIIVGMLVSIECPKVGTSGKGVCVRVWDPAPGVVGHEIAVQLIKPQNLWGVPNPPSDWEAVAKTMVQGRTQVDMPAPVMPSSTPGGPAPRAVTAVIPTLSPSTTPTRQMPSLAARLSGLNQMAGLVPPPAPAPAPTTAAAPAPPIAVAPPSPMTATRQFPAVSPAAAADPKLADLERRATQLVSSVLDIMRGQAEELTRNILEELRQQVDALIVDSTARLRQGFQQAYEESAASLINLRADLMQQMQTRGTQMIRTSEETLRTRLRGQLAIENAPEPEAPPAKVTEK